MKNRRTRTHLATSKTALIPSPIDASNTKQQIIDKRIAAKVIYHRKAGPFHSKPATGTCAYAKAPPQQWGHPWIYRQITDSDDQSYTLKAPNNTGSRLLQTTYHPCSIARSPSTITLTTNIMSNENKYRKYRLVSLDNTYILAIFSLRRGDVALATPPAIFCFVCLYITRSRHLR